VKSSLNTLLVTVLHLEFETAPIETAIKKDLIGRNPDPEAVPLQAYCVWACKIIAGAKLYEYALCRKYDKLPKAAKAERIPLGSLYHSYFKMLRGEARIRYEERDFPFTLLSFTTKVPHRKRRRFDLQIYPGLDAFYMRLSHRSLLCRFDGGHIREHGAHFFEPYQKQLLAPLQMEELAANFFTMATRQSGSPLYLRFWNAGVESIVYIPVGNSGFIDRDDDDDLIEWMARCTRCPRKVFEFPGGRRTFLFDEDNQFWDLPVNTAACRHYREQR
jgi:hypothetical protein